MYVLCVGNRGSNLPPRVLALGGYGRLDSEYGVEVGRLYTVYGLNHIEGRCVEFDVDPERPLTAPGYMFDIVDGHLSRHWFFGQRKIDRFGELHEVVLSLWGYPEYVQSENHRAGLVDGRAEDVALFRRYREAMDLEFPHPEIPTIAKWLERDWFQCDACLDAWEIRSTDGMLRCPKCKTIQRNPLYVDRLAPPNDLASP